jgi:hypothetical protein
MVTTTGNQHGQRQTCINQSQCHDKSPSHAAHQGCRLVGADNEDIAFIMPVRMYGDDAVSEAVPDHAIISLPSKHRCNPILAHDSQSNLSCSLLQR